MVSGLPCLGETEAFAYMCDFARSGDPVQVRHVVERSAIGATPEPPGLLAKAASFVGAVVQHVATGMHAAPPEVKAGRLAICRSNECGRYSDDPDGPMCLSCGCPPAGLEMKAGWADQWCPLEPPRWGPVEPE